MKKLKIHNRKKINCNICGREKEINEEFASINIEWGYFSEKDGEIHKIHICEECYDKWRQKFVITEEIVLKKELLN